MTTATWDGSATLEELRALPALAYRLHTVIRPTGGVDGSLQGPGDTFSYPLDLWTPAEFRPSTRTPKATTVSDAEVAWAAGLVESIYEDHGVLLPSEEMSPEIVRAAVTRWCREHLGREDVTFDLGEAAGAEQ
jgi:hypothetical protein